MSGADEQLTPSAVIRVSRRTLTADEVLRLGLDDLSIRNAKPLLVRISADEEQLAAPAAE